MAAPDPTRALPDHYAALGVAHSAPHTVVRAAYRRIIRAAHPDVVGEDAESVERAVAANAAWAVLKDPARRAAYDRQRSSLMRGPAAAWDPPHGRPSWGPGGIRPTTIEQLREAAARESAYSPIVRAQREAFSRASLRVGVAVVLLGALVLLLAVAAG